MLGGDLVAKALPDGHTLLRGDSGSLVITSLVQPNVPDDIITSFAPVGFTGASPNVIGVNPRLAARTLSEFRDVAKRATTPLTYGTSGALVGV